MPETIQELWQSRGKKNWISTGETEFVSVSCMTWSCFQKVPYLAGLGLRVVKTIELEQLLLSKIASYVQELGLAPGVFLLLLREEICDRMRSRVLFCARY